jgi:dienelactone hydrolase
VPAPVPTADTPGTRWFLPGEILLAGRGSGAQRSWIFLELLRHAGLDGVMLATGSEADGGLRPWVPAVISAGEAYLFEPTYGMPVPGPGGAGIATARQAAADPAILTAMSLPDRAYPVIESIYAGPQGQFVPKSFQAVYSPMILAELGFIVVQIDGMGTNWRNKAFHDVCWKNLGDSGFPDRMKWIKAAAAKYPEFNLSKGVGIYGGSAGGQSSTRAVLAHPDFYSVAVSDCGCHDNRMDKVWWNELWMSWPIGPHYAEQSNSNPEMVKRLKGKLMLTVGEMDENVDPASTMQVVAALIKANKDFDFLMVPGGGHGAGESPYGQRRRADFFVRHLMGVEPRR